MVWFRCFAWLAFISVKKDYKSSISRTVRFQWFCKWSILRGNTSQLNNVYLFIIKSSQVEVDTSSCISILLGIVNLNSIPSKNERYICSKCYLCACFFSYLPNNDLLTLMGGMHIKYTALDFIEQNRYWVSPNNGIRKYTYTYWGNCLDVRLEKDD